MHEFKGDPEELLKLLATIKEQAQPEYEEEGESIVLLKNYPALKDMCDEGVHERAAFKKEIDDIVLKFDQDQEAFRLKVNAARDAYWARIGAYCEKMSLFPPEFNTKDYGLDIENGAVVIKKRLKPSDKR